jgi:hypothetical protein
LESGSICSTSTGIDNQCHETVLIQIAQRQHPQQISSQVPGSQHRTNPFG